MSEAIVNMHDAKTQLSRLVRRVEAGEEIVLGRAGRPVAKLVPFRPPGAPRRLGGWEGRIVVHDDFDDPLPEEIAAAFRGERP